MGSKNGRLLKFNEYDLLQNSGSITAKLARSYAEKQYEKFGVIQDKNFQSDFDKIFFNIFITGILPKEGEASEYRSHKITPTPLSDAQFGKILGAVARAGKPAKEELPSGNIKGDK